MVETGDFISLIHNNKDWLDKPHFPFWICALSFKLFGVSAFAYFLPMTTAILLSFLYTYKFAINYYTKSIAWLSVLVLATAQYTFMASSEGRIEPYLMLGIIASVYHFDIGFFQKKTRHLAAMAFYVAMAIMTKGIFIIVPIFGGIFGQILYKTKSVKQIFSWRVLLSFFLIVLFILPEVYALYIQFDSQPNKVVFNKTGVSGIRWFLWDSQFSRLVNSGPITRDSGDIFFFIHTLLWAFFPWGILLYFSFYKRIKALINKEKCSENYTLFGGILILILFSISKFQLPHYIPIVFPFYAILVANVLHKSLSKLEQNIVNTFQGIFIVGGVLLLIFITIVAESSISFTGLCLVILGLMIMMLQQSNLTLLKKMTIASATMSLIINFYLCVKFFPEIVNYRGGISAAEFINKNYNPKSVTTIGKVPNVFNFYNQSHTKKYIKFPKDKELKAEFVLYFLKDSTTTSKLNRDYSVIKKFDHYNAENIDFNFINPAKRRQKMSEFILYKRN